VRNPYVTGSYVTGPQHYGRENLIDCLLHGQGRAYWVVGNRRIGKTSLLRHLETLALAEPGGHLIPLFWDMQGCNSYACIGRYLADAASDHPERFEGLGINARMLRSENATALLANLRRRAHAAGREILLLVDETEVLLNVARGAPLSMQQLHKQLTAGGGLRVVMTSTRQIYKMHDICRSWPTSSFLAGFDMSFTLGRLSQRAAASLIVQAQSLSGQQVQVEPAEIQAISDATNNHPLLLQWVCSRLFDERGCLMPLTDDSLRVDPMLAGFFEHDFRLLTGADRRVLLAVHRDPSLTPEALASVCGDTAQQLEQRLYNLEALGYIRRDEGRVSIGNRFMNNWLSTQEKTLDGLPSLETSDAAMQRAYDRQQPRDRASQVRRLNERRGRLVELEATRARDFLGVSPQVLEEIEQLENEIGTLRRSLSDPA
jgi:hypothetical protein